MIIVKAPLRISFVGGGTDLFDFYKNYPGRVISTTIDKYVYLVINSSYNMNDFILKYQKTEKVNNPKEIVHNRFRAAFNDYGITRGLEIGSFADIPAKTGLGSSSSFSVALVKGLSAYLGKTIGPEKAAEEACRLEIDILKEPIGKQDQYAAAFGGFNIFQFNPDNSVDVEPVLIDFKKRADLESHLLLFFTGVTRSASEVLFDQKGKIEHNLETYKKMSDSVFDFRDRLLAGDFKGLAEMLHEGWLRKKSLSGNVSNSVIDMIYEAGIKAGAWGGKILGAGGGGCLLFIAPPESHQRICEYVNLISDVQSLAEFKQIPVSLTQSGANIIYNSKN